MGFSSQPYHAKFIMQQDFTVLKNHPWWRWGVKMVAFKVTFEISEEWKDRNTFGNVPQNSSFL